MNKTPFKVTKTLFYFLLASIMLISFSAEAQTIKTYSYSTGNLFKKKKKKKGQESETEKETEVNSEACYDHLQLSIKWVNSLAGLTDKIPNLAYQGRLQKIATVTVKNDMVKLDGLLPESQNYLEEAQSLETMLHKCRDQGFTHINAEGYRILAEVEADFDAAITSALANIETANQAARKNMGIGQSSIFVDQESKPLNIDKAKREYEQSKLTLPALKMLLERVPTLQSKYTDQLTALEKSYAEIGSKLGEAHDKFFVSPFHKENADIMAFSTRPVTPGDEANVLKTSLKAGDPFSISIYTKDPFQNLTSYSAGDLAFYVGDQLVSRFQVSALSGNEIRKTGFNSIQVLFPTAAENLENKKVETDGLIKWLRTCAKLTPVKHKMTVKYLPQYGNKVLVSGELTLDCTSLTQDGTNSFSQLADEIEAEIAKREEDQYLEPFQFVNKLQDARLKSKVEKHLVEMGGGLVKRSRVFFKDRLWTEVTNEFGVSKYRRIAFEYILVDIDGNYYAGYSTLAQRPLTNGSFDTSETKPVSDVLEEYGEKRLKTKYSSANNMVGERWGQRIISKEKLEKYMK